MFYSMSPHLHILRQKTSYTRSNNANITTKVCKVPSVNCMYIVSRGFGICRVKLKSCSLLVSFYEAGESNGTSSQPKTLTKMNVSDTQMNVNLNIQSSRDTYIYFVLLCSNAVIIFPIQQFKQQTKRKLNIFKNIEKPDTM